MRFRVNGLPAPQGSKRHVGGGRMVESSRAVGPWREAVRAEAQRARGDLWACGDCGWQWPLKDAPYQDAECDACGGTMEPACPVCGNPGRAHHGPVSVVVMFVLPRPKSHYGRGRDLLKVRNDAAWLLPSAPRYPAKRPDLDKLARAVLDGLVAGGVMADDAQVVRLFAEKQYAVSGVPPGAVIDVEAMT